MLDAPTQPCSLCPLPPSFDTHIAPECAYPSRTAAARGLTTLHDAGRPGQKDTAVNPRQMSSIRFLCRRPFVRLCYFLPVFLCRSLTVSRVRTANGSSLLATPSPPTLKRSVTEPGSHRLHNERSMSCRSRTVSASRQQRFMENDATGPPPNNPRSPSYPPLLYSPPRRPCATSILKRILHTSDPARPPSARPTHQGRRAMAKGTS